MTSTRRPGRFFEGAWGWFAVMVALAVFNTVLGEELFSAGFLLPRMEGAFGRRDWIVNGAALRRLPHARAVGHREADRRGRRVLPRAAAYRSAVLGIIIHSVQSVLITTAVLALVLG